MQSNILGSALRWYIAFAAQLTPLRPTPTDPANSQPYPPPPCDSPHHPSATKQRAPSPVLPPRVHSSERPRVLTSFRAGPPSVCSQVAPCSRDSPGLSRVCMIVVESGAQLAARTRGYRRPIVFPLRTPLSLSPCVRIPPSGAGPGGPSDEAYLRLGGAALSEPGATSPTES